MLKQFIRPLNILLLVVLASLVGYGYAHDDSVTHSVMKGSFHISQAINNQWEVRFVEPYSVTYQTKNFQLTPQNNSLKIRINQQSVSYGDIEFVHLKACGQNISPDYARYVQSGENVLDDILYDDHNVAINHENPIEILWNIPGDCHEDVTVSMKANEYESPEENAFRFPNWGIPSQSYDYQHSGSLFVDGNISEVDGIFSPLFSPFWTAATGHPSNNTLLYLRDDSAYIYVAADVLLDNTNEFGQDWIKVIALNTFNGIEKEYRVDDYTDTYGKCAFGLTSKVAYKHQTCEIRIPKNEILGQKLDFILRYYGTGGGGDPSVGVGSVSFSDITGDRTPTIRGTATAADGASEITSVGFGLADSHGAGSGNVVADYDGVCTANDGVFDELVEPFTCTTSTLAYGEYRMFLRATNGSQSGTNSTAIFTVSDDIFYPQINSDGFGSANNTESMLMDYAGVLYAGTRNSSTNAEFWSYDDVSWTQESDQEVNGLTRIASMVTFDDLLYALVIDEEDFNPEIWSFNGSLWSQVTATDMQASANAYGDDPAPMAVYDSNLYIGVFDGSTEQSEIWKYNGSTWTQVNTDGFGDAGNTIVTAMKVHNSKLYIGTRNSLTGTEVWSYDGNTWTQVNVDGFAIDDMDGTFSLEVYEDELYAGTYHSASLGASVWKYSGSGTTWTQVNTDGFGDTSNGTILAMKSYNGLLYAGTYNSNDGSEVWAYNGTTWSLVNDPGFSSDTGNSRTQSLHAFKGILYASVFNETTGTEVWELNTDTAAPTLSLTAITDPTTDTTPTLTGTATDAAGAHVTDVEFQMDGTGGAWTNCTADDATFDESSEAFTCTVTVALSAGSHTMYVRATDSNDNTTGSGDESEDAFTVSASPTASPTAAPSSNVEDNSESETPQIPQGQSEEIGGNFTPIKDSYTGGQSATVIVEPGTFSNDAYFSAQLSESQFSNGILANPLAGALNPDLGILPTNIVLAGGIGGKLGIKQACGIAWQVGGVHQMWYKTYPPEGSNKPAAIIIPELQVKPSIIALSYKDTDLTPPGNASQRFLESQLKLAHSMEGAVWRIMPTSVVDPINNTVAALEKLGGYYMIVASCGGTTARTFVPSTLGETTINEDAAPAEDTISPEIKKEKASKPAQSTVKTESFFQKVTKVVRKILNIN